MVNKNVVDQSLLRVHILFHMWTWHIVQGCLKILETWNFRPLFCFVAFKCCWDWPMINHHLPPAPSLFVSADRIEQWKPWRGAPTGQWMSTEHHQPIWSFSHTVGANCKINWVSLLLNQCWWSFCCSCCSKYVLFWVSVCSQLSSRIHHPSHGHYFLFCQHQMSF